MPYHVTKKENGINIWKSRSIDPKPQNRKRRRNMRIRIDDLGNEMWSNWVNRQNAVFAWSTFDRATRYAERFREAAIVEFECEGTAWCVDNFVVEDIYGRYSKDTEDDVLWILVTEAEEWQGKRDNDIEVWMQPEAVGEIYGVYDGFGEPIEIDKNENNSN